MLKSIRFETKGVENKGSVFTLPSRYLGETVFNNDGTKFYVSGQSQIKQYSTTSPYSVANMTLDGAYAVGSNNNGIAFNSDGSVMYTSTSQDDRLYRYTLTNNFNVLSGVTQREYIGSNGGITSISVLPGDNKIVYTTYGAIKELTLGAGGLLTGATVTKTVTIPETSSPNVFIYGFTFNASGNKAALYVNNALKEFSFTTPFDIDTLIDTGYTFFVQGVFGISTDPTGEKVFLTIANSSQIHELKMAGSLQISLNVTYLIPAGKAFIVSNITPRANMLLSINGDSILNNTDSFKGIVFEEGQTISIYTNTNGIFYLSGEEVDNI